MKTKKLLLLSLTFLAFVLTNCSKNDNASTDAFSFGSTVNRDFTGKIVDINQSPISNVTISMGGQTVVTDSDGVFTLPNISVLENFGYLTATKTGFISGSRTVFPHDGMNRVKIMLLPYNVIETIPSGQASTVSLPDNTKVTFDGAFMTTSGSNYTGNIKIVMNHLDSSDPNVFDKMPGNLIGTRIDGSISGMVTFGMVVVELLGDNDQKLQISTGHTANISMQIASNKMASALDNIPLWSFNETSGLWQEEGFSRKIGNRYVGNVSHFTWWNNDSAYVGAKLNVFVNNADGTPVNGVRITITRLSGSTGDVIMDLGFTGLTGTLSSIVPKNEVLIFKAYDGDGILINTQSLPASNLAVRDVYVIIPVANKIAN